MTMSCPINKKIQVAKIPTLGSIFNQEDIAYEKPDELIIGRITISMTKCPKMLYLWHIRKTKTSKLATITTYRFQTDTILRLNITFLHFELGKTELVWVIHAKSVSMQFTIQFLLLPFLNCFQVTTFYCFWLRLKQGTLTMSYLAVFESLSFIDVVHFWNSSNNRIPATKSLFKGHLYMVSSLPGQLNTEFWLHYLAIIV